MAAQQEWDAQTDIFFQNHERFRESTRHRNRADQRARENQ
jgi:hypothetical protein